MAALQVLLVAALLLAQVMGHAVLVTPTPLNTNPTTANPCGATVPATATPVATFVAGQSQVIKWKLIAGDGGTRVTGKIDPKGGTDFSVDMWTGEKTHGSDTGVTYDIAFTVPTGVNCAGGACTFQVRSNTGWVSCSMINISSCTGCPTPAPAPPACTRTNALSFCTAQSTKNVLIPADSSAAVLDNNAANAFKAYLSNVNVFKTNTTECQTRFKEFICAENLPPCQGSDTTKIAEGTACHGMCQQTMDTCGLTDSHKDLYDCNSYPLCNDEDSSSSILSSSIAALAAAFVAFALL